MFSRQRQKKKVPMESMMIWKTPNVWSSRVLRNAPKLFYELPDSPSPETVPGLRDSFFFLKFYITRGPQVEGMDRTVPYDL